MAETKDNKRAKKNRTEKNAHATPGITPASTKSVTGKKEAVTVSIV